jgi:hypothetical protein
VTPTNASSESRLERVRAAYREAAAECRHQREALRALRDILLELAEESLRLHRRTRATIEQLSGDVERMKRRLERLNTART